MRGNVEAPAPSGAGRGWRQRAAWLVGLLVAVIATAYGLYWLAVTGTGGIEVSAASAPPVDVASVRSAAPPPVLRPASSAPRPNPVEGDADPSRDLKSYLVRGETPAMPEVIERLHERGVTTGLGAFSPPGTRPPLMGLAVPEEFELPPGYVRHYQATDDGQRIEAVLMFAPDFQLFDADHQPVAMPADRIVPAALAPAGIPLRRIAIPAPREPLGPGH